MVYNHASSAIPTGTRTRITAFLVLAGLVLRAFGVDYALWSTGRRAAVETRHARTHSLAVYVPALAVWSAGGRDTGIRDRGRQGWSTRYERTSFHSVGAAARWDVVDDLAYGVLSAGSGTRVVTLVPHTSAVSGAFGVHDTFWAASLVRISVVFGQTSADSVAALSVRSARRRIARIIFDRCWRRRRFRVAASEWISFVAFNAQAHGNVVENIALRICSAGSWARVLTFLLDAGEVARALGINSALRTAIRRTPNVANSARARWRVTNSPAFRVGPARRWYAWIDENWSWRHVLGR